MATTQKYILVVDDEPVNVSLLTLSLEKKGYRAVGALSGKEAIEQIKKEKPALVLLDIMMPGMDGFETLRQIKEFDKKIPVTMVSAVNERREMLKCIELGAGAYIGKPVDVNKLEEDLYIKAFFK